MPLSIGFFIRFLKFPSHSPLIPLIQFLKSPHSPHSPGFSRLTVHSLSPIIDRSLSVVSLPLLALGSLQPFPCSLKKQDTITDSRGRTPSPFPCSLSLGSLSPITDLLLIPSSQPSFTRQFLLLFASLSLCWIRCGETG